MIKSMTGYGKSQCQLPDMSVSIEVKSLNGKTLDINLKVPGLFKSKEQEIRSLIGRHLCRGKTELSISVDSESNANMYALNRSLMDKYYEELKDFAARAGASVSDHLIPAILRLPEVVQQEEQSLGDNEWETLMQGVIAALLQCDEHRLSEGAHLEKDLKLRIHNISVLLDALPALEKTRIESLRERLLKNLESLKDLPSPDPGRFEQEMLYYLEKLDLTEEVVRLRKHLAYFTDTMSETISGGKKLGFISQEIGREINTIGSKANDAEIQKVVVEMKDELEKIKEQLMNIL